MSILVTGGAGFIGSNFINFWLKCNNEQVINLDKLTYAGNLDNLIDIKNNNFYIFYKGEIGNENLVSELLNEHKPRFIVNFASETHVDKSIHNPEDFISTNIVGTFKLLESTKNYFNKLKEIDKENFRFLHISTDEVYGSLNDKEAPFNEKNCYKPNSPYSASKASSDHLVRSYYRTYNLPVLITNCSNNYGPYQYPEKLIPLIIYNALQHKQLPVYGDGLQIRDWLYVEDHCEAINFVLQFGIIGEVYNIGGDNQKNNLEVVNLICEILDELEPRRGGDSYKSLIKYVKDRTGHDRRYAIDIGKIKSQLNWKPSQSFNTGIKKTVKWYLDNQSWVNKLTDVNYHKWINKNYK